MRFLALMLLAFAAHATPPAITWSPVDHSAWATISGNVATRNTTMGGSSLLVRSDTPQSTGVRYVEFTIVELGNGAFVPMELGVANGMAPANLYPGATNNGVSYRPSGAVIKNAAYTGVSGSAYTTGDVVGMSVDLDAHAVKFRKNGGAWSATVDIASLGTDVYAAVSLGDGATFSSVALNATGNWNDYQYTTLNIVAAGDSITLSGGVEQTYLPRLAKLIRDNRVGWAATTKAGINGVTWGYPWSSAGYPYSLIQDAPIRVDPARSALVPNWLIAFAGTNGFAIFHDTAARQCADMLTYVTQRIAASWQPDHIIIPTMLPRDGVEAERVAYNACIDMNAPTYGYKVARLDLDPDFGQAGQNADPSKYPDRVHPSDSVQQGIAQIFYAIIFP